MYVAANTLRGGGTQVRVGRVGRGGCGDPACELPSCQALRQPAEARLSFWVAAWAQSGATGDHVGPGEPRTGQGMDG